MPHIDGRQIDVLFSEEQIAERNNLIAAEIAASNPSRLLVLPILKGSFVFAADLIRALHKTGIVSSVEFITVSSYGESKIPGNIRLVHDIDSDIAGRDVLLIDDILESGNTLQFVQNLVSERGAKSSRIAVLLDKHTRRQADISADYVGFECPDEFVVGYGMDVAHSYRQLPFVGVVKE
ncbi:hypoxanthine phosphoribosyltransferase [Bartonella sp. HY038]|uniref:hypoxanthine phosphoribosyltransferase n=1 Tax=Bartonella sp. HY038 TaxID=2759660 RepID=UPI0015FBD057|nr:hypoxanthine phosphoribosyltransferase [Bartonella sp. HY038]